MQKPIIFGPFLGRGHFGVGPLFDPFLDGFWCIAMAIRAFLDVRFPKKRLAWIRTHARLRVSFPGI